MQIDPRKKKIMLTLDGFGQGGIQQAYKILLAEYSETFDEVYLMIMQSSENELPIEVFENSSILRVEGKCLLDWKSFMRFRRMLVTTKPEIIIASMYRSQIWSALAKTKNSRLIWVEHNTYFGRSNLQWLIMRILSHRVDKIIGVSTEVSDYTGEKLKKSVSTIPNPITMPTIQSVQNTRPSDFVFIGRLTLQKNPELMLRSFKEFLLEYKMDSILHVIGGGPLQDSLIELARELNLENNCVFHGWLSLNRISEILSQAKTLVSTSTIEGMGLVRLEALASGCCVVTTNTGGTKLFTEIGNAGFFVTSASKYDLAKSMKESLEPRYWDQDHFERRIRFTDRFEPTKIASTLIL